MLRFASMAACLVLMAPAALIAQSDGQEDGAIDLDAIDALFGREAVTGSEEGDDAASDEGADTSESDSSDNGEDAAGEEVDEDSPADGEDNEEDEAAPEPSDLTIAFNGYSLCASEAGAGLEETGFALDVIGREALLRCSGQRAAYVNAFYFSLVPHYPDASEAEIRASAERLVAQSDRAIANVVTREVTDLREIRELDEAAEADEVSEVESDAMADEPSDNDDAENNDDMNDDDTVVDEMEPDAQD